MSDDAHTSEQFTGPVAGNGNAPQPDPTPIASALLADMLTDELGRLDASIERRLMAAGEAQIGVLTAIETQLLVAALSLALLAGVALYAVVQSRRGGD